MSEVSRNRRVTYSQLEQLWEFLDKNRSIATGYNKTSQAREFSKRMWEEIAQNLNSHGDGAIKDWKAWCKYWNDYKSKLKKSVAAVRASHQQTGGGPSNARSLTEIERKFLIILGEDFGTGLPGIRVEPFEREPTEHLSGPSGMVTPPLMTQDPNRRTGTVTPITSNRISQHEISEFSEPQPGPSRRMSPHTPRRSPRVAAAAASPGTPRARPRPASPGRRPRRRTVRRDPPMSQEAARRALIEISSRRADIEEQNSTLLAQLVAEIQDIKEILQRYSGLPTDVE